MTQHKKNNCFVLVDYENIAIPLNKQGNRLDLSKDLFTELGDEVAEKSTVYVIYTYEKFISDTKFFLENRYTTIPVSGRKNSADITLVVEALGLAYENKDSDPYFIFFLGDADYIPLLKKIDSLKINYSVYCIKSSLGQDLKKHCEESQYANICIFDEKYPEKIKLITKMKNDHLIALQQLQIAEGKARGYVSFKMFKGFLMSAKREFGRQLTEQEASALIDEIVEIGYVNRENRQLDARRTGGAFTLNTSDVAVSENLGLQALMV